jgi:hypothetical protein
MTAVRTPRLHSVIEVAALSWDNSTDPFNLADKWFIASVSDERASGYLICSDYNRDLEDFDSWTDLDLKDGLWREVLPE